MTNSKSDRQAVLHQPVRTDRDLDRLWRALMGPLGFGSRRLWLQMIDADDQPLPQLTEIDDIPYEVDAQHCEALMGIGRHLIESLVPGGSLAILFSRPGRNPMTQADRRFARALAAAAQQRGVALRPTHFANDVTLGVFAVDDLIGSPTR